MGTSNPCFSRYLCVNWLPCIFKITSSALVERNDGVLAEKHSPSTAEIKKSQFGGGHREWLHLNPKQIHSMVLLNFKLKDKENNPNKHTNIYCHA